MYPHPDRTQVKNPKDAWERGEAARKLAKSLFTGAVRSKMSDWLVEDLYKNMESLIDQGHNDLRISKIEVETRYGSHLRVERLRQGVRYFGDDGSSEEHWVVLDTPFGWGSLTEEDFVKLARTETGMAYEEHRPHFDYSPTGSWFAWSPNVKRQGRRTLVTWYRALDV